MEEQAKAGYHNALYKNFEMLESHAERFISSAASSRNKDENSFVYVSKWGLVVCKTAVYSPVGRSSQVGEL